MIAVLAVETLLPPESETLTSPDVHGEDWFEPQSFLGRRGTKFLPRGAQLAAACAAQLDTRVGLQDVPEQRRGIWIATSTFAERMHDELDAVITQSGAMEISPVAAPYFSVNLVASRLAKDTGSHGASVTVTTPDTGLADAFTLAGAALSRGRVDRALVVCVEVPWGLEPRGDGAVVFVLGHSEALHPQVSIASGFTPRAGVACRLLDPELDPVANQSDRRHRIFTDLSIDDPALHAAVDLEGESIDAELQPLTRSLLPQAMAIAGLVSSGATGAVTVVTTAGAWVQIHVSLHGQEQP